MILLPYGVAPHGGNFKYGIYKVATEIRGQYITPKELVQFNVK